jgi:hypothetical protein
VERDSIKGALIIEYAAIIAAWVGDKDLACERLAAAVLIPAPKLWRLETFAVLGPTARRAML